MYARALILEPVKVYLFRNKYPVSFHADVKFLSNKPFNTAKTYVNSKKRNQRNWEKI